MDFTNKGLDDEVPIATAVSILHLSEADTNEAGEESSLAPEAIVVNGAGEDRAGHCFPVPHYIQVPGMVTNGSSFVPCSTHFLSSVPSAHSSDGTDTKSTNSPQSYPTDDTVVGSRESCFSSLYLDYSQEFSVCSLTRNAIDPPGSDAESIVSSTSSRVSVDPPGSTSTGISLTEKVSSRPDPQGCRIPNKAFLSRHIRRNAVPQQKPRIPFYGMPQRGPPGTPNLQRTRSHISHRRDPPESLFAASRMTSPGAYCIPPSSKRFGSSLSSSLGPESPRQPVTNGTKDIPKAFVCLEATLVQDGTDCRNSSAKSSPSKLTMEVSIAKEKAFNKRTRFITRLLMLILVFIAAAGFGYGLWHELDDERAPANLRRGPNSYDLELEVDSEHSRKCTSQESDYQVCLSSMLDPSRATLCTQCVQDTIRAYAIGEQETVCDTKDFCDEMNMVCDCGPCKIAIVEWLNCSVKQDGDSCSIDCYE